MEMFQPTNTSKNIRAAVWRVFPSKILFKLRSERSPAESSKIGVIGLSLFKYSAACLEFTNVKKKVQTLQNYKEEKSSMKSKRT